MSLEQVAMLIELPFISQIIALLPRDKTPNNAIVRDSDVFEIPEAELGDFKIAARRTQWTGNRGPTTVYWKDGDFWCYFAGGMGGVDAKEALIDKIDPSKWHWFASVIGPENFLFSHFPSGSFIGYFEEQPMPRRERIFENYREHVLAELRPSITDNCRIVEGSLMVKVSEPSYVLAVRNCETKKNPVIHAEPHQSWMEPKTCRGLNKGHVFSALDWDGFRNAQASFKRIAPDAMVGREPPPLEILIPEAFACDALTYSGRSLAKKAYWSMLARAIPAQNVEDVGRLYELFEHQANRPDVVDRIVDVMSRVVTLADLEDRLAWELFLERYDEAPIALAI
jgi:hypothetical protein